MEFNRVVTWLKSELDFKTQRKVHRHKANENENEHTVDTEKNTTVKENRVRTGAIVLASFFALFSISFVRCALYAERVRH